MDEMSNRMRANMERVLRAMDVIPPFESHGEPQSGAVEQTHSPRRSAVARSEQGLYDETPVVVFADDVLSVTDDGAEAIPTLDLGEKILAEQRRATARTRRAPGAAPPAPDDVKEQEALLEVAEPVGAASDEVAQLQQIVADIVARDIEELCQGLKR
jgi:hypothetical protein